LDGTITSAWPTTSTTWKATATVVQSRQPANAAIRSAPGVLTGPPGQPSPDLDVIPRRGGDELLQLLMIDPQPLGHRLHRHALARQHQPTQIQLPLRPLITPYEPTEHPPSELLDHRPNLIHLLRKHPQKRSHQTRQPAATTHLTKHY